ncbi:hypothetical protein [Streptomyces sp. NPDC056188]|uniref:hypothetical protein n=1 Tax=Streptomyces sp. NPDC056188 TaxID=3345740 RepID=UPI0035E117EF
MDDVDYQVTAVLHGEMNYVVYKVNDVLREIDPFTVYDAKADDEFAILLIFGKFLRMQLQRGAAINVKFDYDGNHPFFENFAVSHGTCMRIDLTRRNPASRTPSTSRATPKCRVRRLVSVTNCHRH